MPIFYFVDDARDGRFDCFMYVVVGEKAVDGSLADLSLFGHLIEGHLVESSIAKQMLHCIHYFLFFVSLLQLMTSHRILTSQFWFLFDALSGKGWKRIYDHLKKKDISASNGSMYHANDRTDAMFGFRFLPVFLGSRVRSRLGPFLPEMMGDGEEVVR